MAFYTIVHELISIYKTIFLKVWEKKFLVFSFLGLLIFSIFFVDYNISFFIVNNKRPFLDYIAGAFNLLGSRKILYLITPIIYIVLRFLNKKRAAKMVLLSAFVALISESAVTIIKFLLMRDRPETLLDPFCFFSSKISMPSGHIAASVALLALTFQKTKNFFIKASIFSFWILVSFSRVYSMQHWFSDCLVSWFIPLFIVYSLSND